MAYYLLSRLPSVSSLLSLYYHFTEIVFTVVISKISSLEALLSQELGRSKVSAQWNTSAVATKGLLGSRFNSIISSIFSSPLRNWAQTNIYNTAIKAGI